MKPFKATKIIHFVLIVFAVIMILVNGCLVFFGMIVPSGNNDVAADTAKKLEEIPLPENTEYMEKVSLAGKLDGNGNGMQYLGAILIKSDLPIEELRDYYSDFVENEWECIVENQPDNRVRAVEHEDLEFRSEITGDHYFIVYSWGSNDNIFADWDLRGH